MEKQNRAERRRNKFGGGRATEHGGWPTHQPNPVFTGDAAEPTGEAATDRVGADRPDEEQGARTGSGTGGVAEHPSRTPRGKRSPASDSKNG